MIDDAFVFDCVAHIFNFDPKNALDQPLFLQARARVRELAARPRK